jgi:hypothetical protein
MSGPVLGVVVGLLVFVVLVHLLNQTPEDR